MRVNFEMTPDDLSKLLESMKPVPMIALQCGSPRSAQENANAAWDELGQRMGFDPMTVTPTGKGDRFFSANAQHDGNEVVTRQDGSEWMASYADFVDLVQSSAAFGETEQAAIAALVAASAG